LTYTFDATRVMFSSGNVTEKARMGGLPVEGETIVDLYAGIGYFTLPLLAKGRAGKVHAVEWNTDALACLAINVGRVGGLEGGRCSLWPGDNTTLLARHPHLRACADRVLLGLIPSSVPGWPTALGVLKPEGGVLHVHENVREGEAEEWARGTLIPELARLAEEAGSKAWTFTLEHIERVKGYAPRVAHFVFDVRVRRR
jgi:tRNA G37 N-methylase Trm5